ncbi:MAG: hypothetical protein AUJ18_05195 [Candidatus Hydrogenedentes bacterium CG1_02_42_14]|nr:MAG: hypothetical protein AUJ18_05195 [Candidatus Hydrogenedentes bacterium CG1_02_42_14]
MESANWKVQIGKCKLEILFFQFSFFNYFTRSLKAGILLFIWRHMRNKLAIRKSKLSIEI